MSRFTGLLLFATALAACDDSSDPETFRVRVENQSDVMLEDVVLGFAEDTVEVGDVDPGEVTGYARVPAGQPFVLLSVRADGGVYTMEPAPGAADIEEGDYTFAIGLDAVGGGGLSVEVLTDD